MRSTRGSTASRDPRLSSVVRAPRLDLRKRGTPIPTNAPWIAALVVQHSLVLLDRDSDFDVLPQLARLPLRPAPRS
jgi:predicted nucleic acid-binding protein